MAFAADRVADWLHSDKEVHMSSTTGATVTVVQPGAGDTAEIPGFGAVFKLTGRTTGGLVSIVGHPFAVGVITSMMRPGVVPAFHMACIWPRGLVM